MTSFEMHSGMFAQAIALLLWGFYIVRARGIAETSFFVGMALAVGGIVQFLAGMWEFRTGNTFAATQFSMFGGFWFAVGVSLLRRHLSLHGTELHSSL